jgi:hypothetical protein
MQLSVTLDLSNSCLDLPGQKITAKCLGVDADDDRETSHGDNL